MKCPFCVEDINDAAIICRHCGKKLRKSPAVAAILNFFFWGAGYLYCGRQWAIVILIPFILLNILSIYQMQYKPIEIDMEDGLIVFLIYDIFISSLLAWSAYTMAENYTPTQKKEIRTPKQKNKSIPHNEKRERRLQLILKVSKAMCIAALVLVAFILFIFVIFRYCSIITGIF